MARSLLSRLQAAPAIRSVFGTAQERFASARGSLLVLPLVRFQCGDGFFQLFQLFPRARQHPCLGVEFLASHQVQSGEGGLQQGMDVLFHVLLRTLDAGGNAVADLAREIVNEFGIEHSATIAAGPVPVQSGVIYRLA